MRMLDQAALAGLAVLSTACAEPTADSVETRSVLDGLPAWTAHEDLRIGSLDDPDQALTMVRAHHLAESDDGLLYVGQPRDGNVRVYDDEGQLVDTFGEGPGEFSRTMMSLDTPIAGEQMIFPPREVLADGAMLVAPARSSGIEGEFVHLLVDSVGSLVDTLFSYPTTRINVPGQIGSRNASLRTPFAGSPPTVVASDGESFWTVGDERATGMVSGEGRARELVESALEFPTHYRAAQAALPHREGGIWVRLPPGLGADGDVWAIERDEFDVPYFLRFAVRRSP